MTELYVKATIMKEDLIEAMKQEDGLGTIEIAVIIVILIGLALMFKGKITTTLTSMMDIINADALSSQ